MRSQRSRPVESLEFHNPVISDDRVGVEKNLELSDDARYLIGKINRLDKKYRQILIYRYYDNLSYQEIAELVHVNVKNISAVCSKPGNC